MNSRLKPLLLLAFLAALALFASALRSHAEPKPLPPGVTRVPVVFSGGHDTEGVDHGRPVILIANALGVKPEVFREAFTHVHPAGPGSGGPTDAEARANKAALMSALGKYGVTDERLNQVSNFSFRSGRRRPPPRGALRAANPSSRLRRLRSHRRRDTPIHLRTRFRQRSPAPARFRRFLRPGLRRAFITCP